MRDMRSLKEKKVIKIKAIKMMNTIIQKEIMGKFRKNTIKRSKYMRRKINCWLIEKSILSNSYCKIKLLFVVYKRIL